ncbi:uncharacterized protein I303_101912 [Kwoniella dejecticola CBS 10117]|uniref:Uncharacterized protein n=1 Tax=Kwoniella dejecticola CBS 10117 TaxID=1296121 RepID=A0A1A6ACG0_9TREE|nr:uncharacterized protein I303_01952 [Kwoniella dejecticola CBS 10117]OBR87740.1 hypothetical protein I303_01952 [Kwoniella dejecticola CBS 10117]
MAGTNISLEANDLFSVKDKVVVITGGGTGLGRMMAEGFITNGAKIYITGRRKEVLDDAVKELSVISAKGGSISAIQGDVSTKEGVKKIADVLSEKEHIVDVLVNNAGAQRPWRNPIQDHNDPDAVEKLVWEGVEDDDWNATNATNINGVYFMTAALVPLLRKSDIRSVIVIGSVAALANQRPVSTLTYGVSKAASKFYSVRTTLFVLLRMADFVEIALHLAEMLAGRLSPLKIRVNSILPGAFPSEITSKVDENGNRVLHPPAQKAAMRSPIGRAGYKHEIVGPALLLASQAGGFMDNAIITVDGGRLMNAGINDGIRMPEETY